MGMGREICGTEPLHEAKIVDISKRLASSKGFVSFAADENTRTHRCGRVHTCSRAGTPAVLKRFKLSIAMMNKT